MENTAHRAIAIVGVGAVLPDAPNVAAFWENVKNARYSITDVPVGRWDPNLYYDADPKAPDKTYSKIGGWVREFVWDPVKWRLPIPPRVADAMDGAQKWAIAATREALEDFGYPKRPLDLDRTAVILGNAMAGEKHYLTALRVFFPEYAHELAESPSFAALPEPVRSNITRELHERMDKHLPDVTEDSMPGELANCIAGRIANLFNFRGPNFVCDAACASAMAAISAAIEGLVERDFDAVITGGIDRNMGAPTFVKFCKIGALSATGTRPYGDGADGFVMGEGAAIFLLKRLADAERDGDKIYAVLRGIGGSSDGKGKGITAPNPIGQKFAIERAWQNAGLSPATATLFEGHGTSTRVGDVVEVESLNDALNGFHLPASSIALGSVKSNIGHLKGAAGAAGLLKLTLALHEKLLPPSVHCDCPNPGIDFAHSPLYVNTKLKPWTIPSGGVRRAGLSAFGFGGTNFHAVLEEYIPHRLNGDGKKPVETSELPPIPPKEVAMNATQVSSASPSSYKAPLRGALVIGAGSSDALGECLRTVQKAAEAGRTPAPAPPVESDLHAPERIAIDYGDADELAAKCTAALKAIAANQPAMWKALRAQGIFRGNGPAPKVAFLYTGQGSQYVNMLETLRALDPIVAETFNEADSVMTPLLGKPLSSFIYVDKSNESSMAKAEDDLRQTAITQPAVLATDLALTRMLAAYGIAPDFTMGHSLGEYGALIVSEALPFEDALEAVSARGREMTRVALGDNGKMAAVFAPLEEIERILKTVTGYVVIANINSERQAVVGGSSKAVEQAIELFQRAGYEVAPLPVSHAFHTSIVAPASQPLRSVLERLRLQPPRIPIVANLNGEFYPTGTDVVPKMLDILAQQVAAPVQFVKGLHTLYEAGARVFVEVGPKKALQGFAEDVLGNRGDVLALFTNHPKFGDVVAFNQALCGLYAAGLGYGIAASVNEPAARLVPTAKAKPEVAEPIVAAASKPSATSVQSPSNGDTYLELGRMFADVLERGWEVYGGKKPASATQTVAITGAALGLPGTERIFDDDNIGRILRGEQLIDVIPTRFRRAMLDKHITRLVKSDTGGPTFETINNVADVIKLAGRGGEFDLENEFGVSADRMAALDRVTQLAIAVGIDALRDAGIPLVMRYKTTSKGTKLPDRWGLPDALRDNTGVIFASAFPGYDSFADEMCRYYVDHGRREQLALLEDLSSRLTEGNGHSMLEREIERRSEELRDFIEKEPYVFDRRFLFKTLSMGHSQFAEFIGARGPNTAINAACASTTQAVSLAGDWIRAGRCSRVIVVSADDVTSDHMMEWIGAGFLATGAAATDSVVEEAAIPFDRRRHGMLIGMGAAALVVESEDAIRERGIQPICEVLSAVTANSAFHGTRLDVQHIAQVMEEVVARAEAQHGICRKEIADRTVFVSHETYTPARGGSAAAEIHALRQVFADAADRIVIANTKGFTGHAMATGIEDVVAVKALETGCVPPVSNFKEVDPELGTLNLSKGGAYPVDYALRLAAGFGSQVSMTLLRWIATRDNVRRSPSHLGYEYRVTDRQAWKNWLSRISEYTTADLEIVHRTLRVRDQGMAAKAAGTAEPVTVKATVLPIKPEIRPEVPASPIVKPPLMPSVAPKVAVVPAVEPRVQKVDTAPLISPAVVTQAVSAAVVPPITTEAPSPAPAVTTDDVKERILALVAEKTGYPVDMLDLDLDLEADLGVDTVKQAEVFAAVRETYGIMRDASIKLRDFPTLAHVIGFVRQRRSDLKTAVPVPVPKETPVIDSTSKAKAAAQIATSASIATVAITTPAVATTPTNKDAAGDPVKERILALVVEKTGYPSDMLDLELDLEADLGVDTVKQAEMFAAIREIYNIPRDENRKLRDYPTLAHVIRFVYEKRPDLAAAAQTDAAAVETLTPVPIAIEPVTTVSPAAAVAAFEPASATAPAVTEEIIKERVLAIVGEKTGYPVDMLDLDLDLEADLGIDTVKQAEMFASVRAAFSIPREADLKLRDFPTLAHVIKFASERQPKPDVVAKPPAPAPASAASPISEASATRPAPASFEAANRVPRRVPVAMLRPPLSMCKPTGVEFERGQRVIIMPDKGGVAAVLAQRLRTLGVEVLQIEGAPTAEELSSRIKTWLAVEPIRGVYWLPALDYEGRLTEIDAATWHEAVRVRVKLFHSAMRALFDQIRQPGTFLVSAVRLGGQHGYDEAGAIAPLGGAVSGFTKTYKREQADALVKAVDFEAERDAADIAQLLLDETLRDNGAVEIGYKNGLRWTVGLKEQPAPDGRPGLTLNKETVFLITGAAGSIVSAITADLAAASGGIFYLLDLVPQPDPKSSDLKRFVSDKEGLKRDIFARIQARGERATPALIERELAALERAHAAQSAIAAVQTAGGTAHYVSVNLTDGDGIAKVIDRVRKEHGRIDVLLHAAGLDRSRSLRDKDAREFDLVFDVKSDGFFHLLRAIGTMPLSASVAFSSIAGRFGNPGQTDYSSANDLLCKITSNLRATHPNTRAIAIDWTAWGQIGMASRGSIPRIMETAGIDMLPPEAGVPVIRRELTSGGTRGEVVIGERLGILLNEWDPTGGIEVAVAESGGQKHGPMIGTITKAGIYGGITIETLLDPQAQPFLEDHQIDGTPVLPGVMGIEAFAEASTRLLPHWHVEAVEDINFLAPFKFYRNEPRTLTIETAIRPQRDKLIAECRLIGRRQLPNQADPHVATHFTARVILGKHAAEPALSAAVTQPSGPAVEATDIYRAYFHGPAYQVVERAWRDGNSIVGRMAKGLRNNHEPAALPTHFAPRLIELCFQTAGLWELGVLGRMGLPQFVRHVSVLRAPELAETRLHARATLHAQEGDFDAEVVDEKGNCYLQLRGYRTIALPATVETGQLRVLQSVLIGDAARAA
jgi:acyl transferase domain-containing protein/NAD(P)-dependent dehydrogenase (short-subunit alcohol dehydrogenase family)/acyl carrier protein